MMFFHQATAEEYLGTDLDEKDHLDRLTSQKVVELSMLAAQVAGQIALRLVHDHILRLDVTKYTDVITNHVSAIIQHVDTLKKNKVLLFFVICVMRKKIELFVCNFNHVQCSFNRSIKLTLYRRNG